MTSTGKRDTELSALLEQFLINCPMSEAELEATRRYLFGDSVILPFFKDSELYDALNYMHDVANSQGLNSFGELLDYFEDHKRKMRRFLCNLTEETKDKLEQRERAELPWNNRNGQPIFGPDQLFSNLNTCHFKTLDDYYDKMKLLLQNCKHQEPTSELMKLSGTGMFDTSNKKEALSAVSRCGMSKTYLKEFSKIKSGIRVFVCVFDREQCVDDSFPILVGSEIRMADHPDLCIESQIDKDYSQLIKTVKERKLIWGDEFKLKLLECAFLMSSKTEIAFMDEHPKDRILMTAYSSVMDELGKEMQDILLIFTEKLSERKWVILTCPNKYSWVTSDNPGFSVSKDAVKEGRYPFFSADFMSEIADDTVLYFPLSKEYCLSIQPEENQSTINSCYDSPIRFKEASEKEVQVVNELTVSTCKEIIVASDRKFLLF